MKKKKHYISWENLKLTQNNTFNYVFCNKIFPYYHFLPNFLKNDWIFINYGLFLREKYSLQLYCFQFCKYVKNIQI